MWVHINFLFSGFHQLTFFYECCKMHLNQLCCKLQNSELEYENISILFFFHNSNVSLALCTVFEIFQNLLQNTYLLTGGRDWFFKPHHENLGVFSQFSLHFQIFLQPSSKIPPSRKLLLSKFLISITSIFRPLPLTQ